MVVLVAVIVVAGLFFESLRGVYEDVAIRLFPSAERAFEYGHRHFDAGSGWAYDIDRAERMYHIAAELDGDLPYISHELARIAFLRGDFDAALGLIDRELAESPSPHPSSHYVRGLILGFMERYIEAAKSFETYLGYHPNNWAGVNDYAWVLLKDERPAEALAALENLLRKNQENAWLLNSAAIAAYELGEFEKARAYVERAYELVGGITREEWLTAYPGNDPRVASEGIGALKDAIAGTMHTIFSEIERDTLQSE